MIRTVPGARAARAARRTMVTARIASDQAAHGGGFASWVGRVDPMPKPAASQRLGVVGSPCQSELKLAHVGVVGWLFHCPKHDKTIPEQTGFFCFLHVRTSP